MSPQGTSAHDPIGIEQKILQSFEDDLNSQENEPLDLAKWVNEVPPDFRVDLFSKLLKMYLKHCVERGWTISKLFLIQQFPEFQDTIIRLCGSGVGEADLSETTSTRSLQATTVYTVNEQAWKVGGQGTLHESKEASIGNRQVVVKFLNDPSRKDNFQKEVEVTAKLDHPGVVAVYSQGVEPENRKRPFFAMRLIHGRTLEERIAEFHSQLQNKSPRSQKLEFSRGGGIADLIEHIISACHTVSHAHSVGVLHCDLKPRNIICGRFGATIVLDWGSAAHCDVPQDQIHDSTQPIDLPSGTTLDMTLPYASPEQMAAAHEADKQNLTTASDVFSMGATLYQALTGSTPFGSQRTKDSKSDPPSKKNPHLSKRLNAICVKAMQHSPENRYDSVEDLANDLRNWLRDEPILAVADRLPDRLFRIARRHKGVTLASFTLLTVLIVGAWFVLAMRYERIKTLHNLNLTLTLIEDVCEPLGKDEVQNLKELDDIAKQVDTFTTNFEQNHSGGGETLARIYEIKAIVKYYNFTSERKNSDTATNQQSELTEAIEYLTKAEDYYQNSAIQSLAKNRLKQARWLWYLSKARTDDDKEEKDCKDAIGKLEQVIQELKLKHNSGTPHQKSDILLAQAFHLRGEILHGRREIFKSFGFDTIDDQIKKSRDSFTESIKVLRQIQDAEDTMDISRNLARSYGYRGDVYRTSGDIQEAWEDYALSLEQRQAIVEGVGNSIESNFQLARGYANFGMLARDFGLHISEEMVFPNKKGNPYSGKPIEFQIAKAYVAKALQIQNAYKGIGDKRIGSDLTWTSNVAAELYLFAAEHPDLPEDEKKTYLAQAEEYVDNMILMVTGEHPEGLRGISKIPQPSLPSDQKTLALSLMLKLRIEMAQGKSDPLATPDNVCELIPLTQGFASRSEDELLIYLIASLAEGRETHLNEIQEQLIERRFNQLDRLKKHLIGLNLTPMIIQKVLDPLERES